MMVPFQGILPFSEYFPVKSFPSLKFMSVNRPTTTTKGTLYLTISPLPYVELESLNPWFPTTEVYT